MKKPYDCGIDLGTTNSCISIPNADNTCTVIDNSTDRMQVTPSAVWVRGGRTIIGRRAYESPDANVCKEFKRAMGTETIYEFDDSDAKLTPVDLSAEILKSLRSDAEKRINKEIRDTVVTVPAAFTLVQCEATKKAAELAGFRNVILLQEPIAASIAYGAQPDAKNQHWLVFDYGGGTFDVSIVSTLDGRLETITSKGDNFKGGKDLDRIFYEKVILPKLKENYNLENPIDKENQRKLMLDVERCKIELSNCTEAQFETFEACDNSGKIIDARYEIKREDFETAVFDEIKAAIEMAREALTASGVSENEISKIVLVGGTTFIPLVRRLLQEEFDVQVDSSLNPMTVVSEGAALYAAVTVIDDDAEYPIVDSGELLLDLEYEAMTSELLVNVVGKIINAHSKISKVKIDCISNEFAESALWTSGWCNMLDEINCIFDIDVKILNENATNLYKVSVAAEDGSLCALIGHLFEIRHNERALKSSAPPLNNAVGIMVSDGTDNFIDWFFEKDTKLPVKSNPISYELTKTLNPAEDASLEILIYEGDDTYNPPANDLVRAIKISSRDLTKTLEQGTKLELIIEIDESRCVSLFAYVPLYDYELPEQHITSSEGSYKNYLIEMNLVEKKFDESKYTLDLLKRKGINVQSLEEEYSEKKKDFDKYYDLIDVNNDEVHQYIKAFYKFLSKIIDKERQSREEIEHSSDNKVLARIKSNISTYGDASQKAKLEELTKQLENAKNPETRKMIIDKMDGLETVVLYGSFEWLKSVYNSIYSRTSDYMNLEKASFWKSEAQKAIDAKDIEDLKNAIMQLRRLKLRSVGESVNAVFADLKKI